MVRVLSRAPNRRVLLLSWLITAIVICLYSANPSLAEAYRLVDPFDRQAVERFDWQQFPTSEQVNRLRPFVGENNKPPGWMFLHQYKVRSDLGEVSESIQQHDGTHELRITLTYLDDSHPRKCTEAVRRLEASIGSPNIAVDTSYSSKTRLLEKSDVTMDWHVLSYRKQWALGNTMIELACGGWGSEQVDESILIIELSELSSARALQPIVWLACQMDRALRFANGDVSRREEQEFIFGVDLNANRVLRSDNSILDPDAQIHGQSIAFNIWKKEEPLLLQINRYTGTAFGEGTVTVKDTALELTWRGECEKLDRDHKKF